VIQHQDALAATTARRHDIERDALYEPDIALPDVLVARDADRIDETDAKLARHDRGRNEPAARDADDDLERPLVRKARGQRTRIAVQFVPGYRDSTCRVSLLPLLLLALMGPPTIHHV